MLRHVTLLLGNLSTMIGRDRCAHRNAAVADIANSPSGPRAHSASVPSSACRPSSWKARPTNSGVTPRKSKRASGRPAPCSNANCCSSVAVSGPWTTRSGYPSCVARVGLVVVDAVAVEGQRRIAKQKRRVGLDTAAPLRHSVVTLRCGCGRRTRRRWPRGRRCPAPRRCRGVAIATDGVLNRHERTASRVCPPCSLFSGSGCAASPAPRPADRPDSECDCPPTCGGAIRWAAETRPVADDRRYRARCDAPPD